MNPWPVLGKVALRRFIMSVMDDFAVTPRAVDQALPACWDAFTDVKIDDVCLVSLLGVLSFSCHG